ncbi:hypothetical protein KR093_009820 [Drosophila rubida]|uniref:MD-2-related lipid-recognition domain-containing protein n=1 Tax=Drosophila rubida TaxID=30044 RepID=A0AAD4K304_9MUSC|nr:hypothetical protein KR093_009820 [Drosophila rubida]
MSFAIEHTMWAVFMLLLLSGRGMSSTISRFTNIRCEVIEPTFVAFDQCELKMLGRGIVGLNLRAQLLKDSFTKAKVNLCLYRKFSGYRPFIFNVTFDFCKLVAKSNDNLSFQKIYFDAVASKSNLNHSCPFEVCCKNEESIASLSFPFQREIIVQNFVFKDEFLKYLPLPTGEYQVQLTAGVDNEWKGKVSVHILIHDNNNK